MSAALMSLVSASTAPAAPYPRDTKAKGWRFELDYERIEQSDTWVLAINEMRPWLLMLWLTAWRQVPCGSLPSSDELIAARVGMDIRQFRAHRDILMRGWWLAADGRMYHPVITEQVLGLLFVRDREAARKQSYRDKNQQLTGACPTGQMRDSYGIPPSATLPEPEPEPEEKSIARTKSAATAAAKRGSRLPDDWQLPKSWGEWACEELGMHHQAVRLEGQKFADYWHAKTGRDATKADWLATWRNWCRNSKHAVTAAASGDQFAGAI